MSKNPLIAMAALILHLAFAAAAATPASADSNCSDKCKSAYGICYKKSQERTRCQAQLQRCLMSCLNASKKR